MKKVKTYILLIVATLFVACSQDKNEGLAYSGDTMEVNVGIVVPTWADADTRAGVTTADIGIAAGSMQLLCFDKNGYYLGMGKEVTVTPTDSYNGGVKAVVPASTCRIHFIANAALTEQEDWIGMFENTLMTGLTANVGDQMVYWGYVSKSTSEQMKAFLENSSNTVYMLRDVAKVSVVSEAENVESVSLVVMNDADKGTLAPFDESDLSAPFEYDQTDGAEGSYVPVDANKRTASASDMGKYTELYIFESKNNASESLYAIIKVAYTSGTVKYHKIKFTDGNERFYTIKRNHDYQIHVGVNSESAGYGTYDEAVAGEPSNDYYITLIDKVPSITMDDYTLTINGETSVIYHETGLKAITFTTTGDDDMTAEDFYVTWKSADDGLTTPGELQLTYSNGQGTIYFPINTVTTDLRQGVIVFSDSKHRIRRNLNIYSTTPFDFNGELTSEGGDVCLLTNKSLAGVGYAVTRISSSSNLYFYYKVNGEAVTNLTEDDISVRVDADDSKYKVTSWSLGTPSTTDKTASYYGRYPLTVKVSKQNTGSSHKDSKVTLTINGLSIVYTVCNASSKIYSSFHPTSNITLESTRTDGGNTVLKFTVPDNYPDDLMPVTVRIATNDYNPTNPTLDVVVDDTETITGQTWNFWYEYKATTKGTQSIELTPSRTNSSSNELWISSEYFSPQKITFSY